MQSLQLLLCAYLIGGFPTGVLLSKFLLRKDIRKLGSGNPGAVNVWRVFGLKWAVIVVGVDLYKGYLPVVYLPLLFGGLPVSKPFMLLIGLAAVLGHVWSPYLKFRGGKGVATSLGAILAISPLIAIICISTWIVIVLITKYAVIASLICAALYPLLNYWYSKNSSLEVVISLIYPLLLIWTHRENLNRLRNRNELKVGTKG